MRSPGRHIPSQRGTGIDYRVMTPETENAREANSGMLKLIRVDTLRRVHNVGFLVRRLKYVVCGTGLSSKV